MANNRLETTLRQLRQLNTAPNDLSLPDATLLRRFIATQDQQAFAVLVRRHAGMVFGVCRSILRNDADADDALQATFFVLARNAASVRKHVSLASWLHGVAWRVAQRAHAVANCRRKHETAAAQCRPHAAIDDLTWREVQALIHQELTSLPDRYRSVLLFAYWEGLSVDETARQLGWKHGMVKGTLERARARLRRRLSQRGVAVATPLFAGLLVERTMAAVPRSAATSMARAALASRQGVPSSDVRPEALSLARDAVQATWGGRALLFGTVVLLGCFGGLASVFTTAAAPAANESLSAADEPEKNNPALVDDDGNPLPPHALFRLGTTRFRHGGWIQGLALSPDGTTLVSVSATKGVRLWELRTGRCIRTIDASERADTFRGVTFSSDGKKLAMAGPTLSGVWDAETGKPLHLFDGARANAIALAADGKNVILATNDDQSYGLKAWSIETGAQLGEFKDDSVMAPGPGGVRAVSCSPDGRYVASSSGTTVLIWDASQRALVLRLDGHADAVNAIAFSADGNLVASGTSDATVYVWDLKARELKHQLQGHVASVGALAFSPDGTRLVSGSGSIYHGAGKRDPHPVRLWNVATGRQIGQLEMLAEQIGAVVFSQDGKTAYVARGSQIIPWDVATDKKPALEKNHAEWLHAIANAPDGKTIATASGDGTVMLWDVARRKATHYLRGHKAGVDSVVFAPDGQLLASGGRDGVVKVWETSTGKLRCEFDVNGAGFGVRAVFTHDGTRLVISCRDGTVKLWDLATQKPERTLDRGDEEINALAVSPDGRIVAAAGWDRQKGRGDHVVHLWDVHTGAAINFVPPRGGMTMALAFSPDGKRLATAGWTADVYVWDVGSGKVERQWKTPGQSGNAIAFSPDGKFVAGGGFDAVVRVWDVAKEREVQTYAGHGGSIHAAAFSPDGRILTSGSWDTTVLAWDVSRLGK